MGSLTRLLEQCRRAKEHLSAATVTTVPSGSGEEVELSRNDFEELISGPLDRFVGTVEEVLQRNDIPRTNLAAVAIVGGGASIPLLTTRLSERLQVPIHTARRSPRSAPPSARPSSVSNSLAAPDRRGPGRRESDAIGARRGDRHDSNAARCPHRGGGPPGLVGGPDADDPVPYTGPEHSGQYVRDAMDFDDADDDAYGAEAGALPWYKRTALVLSVAARRWPCC